MGLVQVACKPKCPKCSKMLDAAANETDEDLYPKLDDLTICFYCVSMLRYTSDLQLRYLPEEEFSKLLIEEQADLLIMQKRVTEMRAELKRHGKLS